MLNFRRAMRNRLLRQKFQIIRNRSGWVNGNFCELQEFTLNVQGIIVPVGSKTVIMHANGDVVEGAIEIYSPVSILPPKEAKQEGDYNRESDRIKWRNEIYKVMKVDNWNDYGFCKAVAIRVSTV